MEKDKKLAKNLENITGGTDTLDNSDFTFSLVNDACCGCGECVDTCPNGAIGMSEGKAWKNEQLCVGSGNCRRTCKLF